MSLVKKGSTLIDSQKSEYEIERYLGEGVTAEVYEGRRDDNLKVALKILRPDLPLEIKQSFRDERTILGLLASAANALGDDRLALTPRVIGYNDAGSETEFLALEFVQGTPLDELIAERGGFFEDELTALEIASQVLRVLQYLHDYLQRSYTDFQLKNIWWQEETRQVKVMDWNHVSNMAKNGAPPGVGDDLTRFGAYFYQLLTGRGARQSGETERALAERAGTKWNKLSAATRAMIRRALHPNKQRRWASAEQFRSAVEDLRVLWTASTDELFSQAVSAVRAVRRSEGNPKAATEYIEKAEALLDMYIRRSEDATLAVRLQEELQDLTQNVSSSWGSGLQYYKAGIFSESTSLWTDEARAFGRASLWRWVMLSQIGATVGETRYSELRASLEDAVQAMDSDEWETAERLLERARSAEITGTPFNNLMHELSAHQHFQQAQIKSQVGAWHDAAREYRAVAQQVEEIDDNYRKALQIRYGWEDISARAEQAEHMAEYSEANETLLQELEGQFTKDFDEGISRLKSALLEAPDNLAVIKFGAERSQKSKTAEEAIALLSTILHYGHPADEEERLWRELTRRRAEATALKTLKAAQEALNNGIWFDLYEHLKALDPEKRRILKDDLDERFNEAVRQHSQPLARALGAALDLVDAESKSSRSAILEAMECKLNENKKAWLDGLPGHINELLLSDDPQRAEAELNRARAFYAGEDGILKQLDEIAPDVKGLAEVKILLETAQKLIDDRQYKAADKVIRTARTIFDQVNVQTLRQKAPYNELEADFRKKAEMLQDALKKEIASAPLQELSEIFSDEHTGEQGMAGAAEGVMTDLNEIRNQQQSGQRWRTVSFIFSILSFFLVIGVAFFVWQTRPSDDSLLGVRNDIAELGAQLDSFSTRQAALASTDEVAELSGEINAIHGQNEANLQYISELQDSIRALGGRMGDIEANVAALPTPQPTRSPQKIRFIPVPGEFGPDYVYDVPDMQLAAPAAYKFDTADASLVAPDGRSWELTLRLFPIAEVQEPDSEDTSAGEVDEGAADASDEVEAEDSTENAEEDEISEMPVTRDAIKLVPDLILMPAQGESETLTVSWSRAKDAPLAPGRYQAVLELASGSDTFRTEAIEFTVARALPVTAINGWEFRHDPEWVLDVKVTEPLDDLNVEAVGKLVDANNRTFLLVRVPGTHTHYWLEQSAITGITGNERQELITNLPDVSLSP